MIRQLNLYKQENDYVLKENESDKQLFIKKKVIVGKELYDAFYNDTKIDYTYQLNTELTDKKDKIIFKQLVELFSKIDEEIQKLQENE